MSSKHNDVNCLTKFMGEKLDTWEHSTPICWWLFLSWSMLTLQCCVLFCYTTKWISYMYTYILSLHMSPPPRYLFAFDVVVFQTFRKLVVNWSSGETLAMLSGISGLRNSITRRTNIFSHFVLPTGIEVWAVIWRMVGSYINSRASFFFFFNNVLIWYIYILQNDCHYTLADMVNNICGENI